MLAALIIPALNEAECLPLLLDAIPPGLFRWIIVADTGSNDDTAPSTRGFGTIDRFRGGTRIGNGIAGGLGGTF